MRTAYVSDTGVLAWINQSEPHEVEGFTAYPFEGDLTADHYYFNGTEIIQYTEEQYLIKQTVPIDYPAHWDNDLMEWVDERTLENSKQVANRRINEDRLTANQAGFTYLDKHFSTDALSRSDIDGIANYVSLNNSLPVDWVGGWKAVDNTYLEITTVQEWKDFYAAMVSVGTANFVKAQALKAQIVAATSVEELEAIVW